MKNILLNILEKYYDLDIGKLKNDNDEMSNLIVKYQEANSQLTSEKTTLLRHNNMLVDETIHLKTVIEELKDSIDYYSEQLRKNKNEVTSLKSTVTSLEGEITNIQNKTLELELVLDKLRNEKIDLTAEVQHLNKSVGTLRNSLTESEKLVEEKKLKLSLNDETITKLEKEIEDKNEKNGLLTNELQVQQKELLRIKHSVNSISIQRLNDGSIVEHEGLNLGRRAKGEIGKEETKFEYLGEFLFDIYKYSFSDEQEEYPSSYYPKEKTSVLKWQKSDITETTGISEPLFYKKLKVLSEINPEIEILQNITISILNREYSYRPDIVVFWSKYNLCIDIEIDEPYDFSSRKPIHYIGSSDHLRNLYFVRQGWVVVRFSEEQIIKDTEKCVEFIAQELKKITSETIFDSFISNDNLEYKDRWTFDEASIMAKDGFRENYLDIDIPDFNDIPVYDSPFDGIAPDIDILPEQDYSDLKKELDDASLSTWIRITLSKALRDQFIFEKYKLTVKNYLEGISGYNLVDEEEDFVSFDMILKIEGLSSPYKSENHIAILPVNEDKRFMELLKEAIYSFNPIKMTYTNASGFHSSRTIKYVVLENESVRYYGDKMGIYINRRILSGLLINGICSYRKERRNFSIYRINTIRILDAKSYLTPGVISIINT